jgi:hypothetical protein
LSPGARVRLEWKLLERWSPGAGAPQRDVDECIAQKGFAVTFIVHASRGEAATTTIRLSVAVAIAKARALVDEGWQVFITGPDGIRYSPPDFDKLLSRHAALHSPP